jgi:hypothetical protein
MEEVRIAWLAGLFDGEGSIGASWEHHAGRARAGWRVAVQMSMTDLETIQAAVATLQGLGIGAIGYSYQERKPIYKDAHYIRVNRMGDIALLADLMLPHSVTKRRQWALARELTLLRLEGVELDEQGRIRRGGHPPITRAARVYSEREIAIVDELRQLNQRGVSDADRQGQGEGREAQQ